MVATVTRLKMAAATVHYFEADGYYAKDDPEHRKASRWHGKAAAALGLHGPVKAKRFEQVLEGHVPGTQLRLGRLRDGAHQHRPGVDVTFSAPKSVSLEALVFASPRTRARVVRAHDEAVRATLDFIEAELLQTRGYDPATRQRPRVKAHGLVAATFRHRASRNLDPQLHTHCVIANMTRDRPGRWRSAEFTALERSKKLIGAYYRHELRRRLEEMGYAAAPAMVGRVPGFEIAGYGRTTLESFSTRRREALAWMAQRNLDYTSERMQQAVLYTRKRKEEPERRKLEEAWRLRVRELDLARDWETARGRGRAPGRPTAAPSALMIAWRAVEHLEERRTVFAANELRAWALAMTSGRYPLGDVDAAIGAFRRDGHLVEATARRADLAFVTGRALAAERDIIAWMHEGIGAGARLASEASVEAGLAASGLNPGQREAVRTVLLSPHRLVGVQGYAGAGKTTMLRAVVELAGSERRIVGLTPSSSATGVLARETGMRARTLQGFLLRYRDVGDGVAGPRLMAGARQVLGGSLVVVDEASMVSTAQMRSLMRIAGRAGAARLVLVGDRRELRSVEAGQPFGLLQEAGMPGAVMDEVMRQRDPALKDAVLHIIARDPALAVEGLGNGVLEMDADALGESAARLWLDLGAGARAGTEVLAPTHRLRGEINAAVRTGLAAEGVLHGRVLTTERYVNLHLTRAQKGDAGNYREGDVAIFNHDVYGITVRGGDACRIAGIEGERVRLEHPDGRPRRIDPSGYLRYRLELYETEPILLQAGDAVRWTRNHNQRRLVNGERADIVAIGAKNVRIRAQDGRVLVLRRDDPQLHHLDHAYSSTVHAAQGITCDNVIAVLDSDHGPLTDQATFYVELTRARDNVVLLTDDKEALVEALETRTGEELSALEAIGEQFASPAPAATVRDKEPLWPALAAWRAFAERALRRGKDPFEAEGCEDAVAPLLALADGAGPPDGIPGDIARIAAEHAARREAAAREDVANLRGTIEACVEERRALLGEAAGAGSGASVHALPGWGRWRGRTRSALAAWRETLADEGRYGVHVDRLEGGRTRIGESVEALETALRLDGLRGALLRDWRALDERARTGGVLRFGDEGYEALIGRTGAFAREAVRPGEMPRGLARLLEEHEARGRARAFVRDRLLPAFSACVEDRGALLAEALRTGTALTDMPAWARWHDRAPAALAAGREILALEKRYGVLEDIGEGARKPFAEHAGALERALGVDDRSGTLLREWSGHGERAEAAGVHPFHREGYDGLIGRIRAHAGEAVRPGEMPRRLARILEEHKALSEAQAFVERRLAVIRACAGERRRLLESAGASNEPFRTRDGPGYARWRTMVAQAKAAARELLDEEARCAMHLDPIKGARALVARTVNMVEQTRALDVLPGWLVRRFEAHFVRAARAGVHPFLAKGIDRIVSEMEGLLGQEGLDETMRRVINYEVAAHAERKQARRHLAGTREAIADYASRRARVVREAAEQGKPLTRHDDYGAWRSDARDVVASCRKILEDTGTYDLFLKGRPDAAAHMRRSIEAIDADLKADDAEIARLERARQLQVRGKRDRGMSM